MTALSRPDAAEVEALFTAHTPTIRARRVSCLSPTCPWGFDLRDRTGDWEYLGYRAHAAHLLDVVVAAGWLSRLGDAEAAEIELTEAWP